jgi:hypothetical protein
VKKTHGKPYNNINCLFNGSAATMQEQGNIKPADRDLAEP